MLFGDESSATRLFRKLNDAKDFEFFKSKKALNTILPVSTATK